MTSGSSTICRSPNSASVVNQTSITGPNNLPTSPVPRDWIANRPMRIRQVIGTTKLLSAGLATASPSTAESTEIAGVITPSP